MDWALWILGWGMFWLAIIAGLALDIVGLFGNWIILAAVVVLWMLTGFTHFGWVSLLVMAGLAVVGEVLEGALAGYGAAKFGGGKGSVVAAVVGCLIGAVVGTPWFPIVGTLAGACLGAFVGAALYEYLQREKNVQEALWTGLGAALGKVLGLFAKVLMGVGMLILALLTY